MLYHPDPTRFIASSGEYGSLGRTLVALSNLEFSHDKFVLKMYERNRDLSIRLSRGFPRHFEEKTDFLINAVANVRDLRQIPVFLTGELNLIWLQYQLDELYEVRTIIAHGSVVYSRSSPDRITWTFERIVKTQKKTWSIQAVQISTGYLASVHYTASAIKRYIVRLTERLENISCWETEYQTDKDIRQNRKFLAELAEYFVVIDENGWMEAFPPLGPVE